jgi:hypothetical protein
MTTRQQSTFYHDNPDHVIGRQCAHCHRRCGDLAGGFARLGGEPLCSKPTEPDRPDCYRLVFTKFHPLRNCRECMS